jgi:hypothetical protein
VDPTGLRRLAVALLVDAIRAADEEWFDGGGDGISFASCCDVVGFDAGKMRRGIRSFAADNTRRDRLLFVMRLDGNPYGERASSDNLQARSPFDSLRAPAELPASRTAGPVGAGENLKSS